MQLNRKLNRGNKRDLIILDPRNTLENSRVLMSRV